MKTQLRIFTFLLLLILNFSCFELVEKVKVYPDESGTFTFILNASKSKTKLESVYKMGTFNGKELPTKLEVKNKVKEISNILNSTKGISDVSYTVDLNNYIFKIRGLFSNVEDLNNSLKEIKKAQKWDANFPTSLYKYSKQTKVFSKNNLPSYTSKLNEMSPSDKEMFSDAVYTSIFQFERPIKNISNKEFKLSPSKKSVKASGKIIDFIKENKPSAVTLHFN